MNCRFLLSLCFIAITYLNISCQDIQIDIIINAHEENKNYHIEEMVNNIISGQKYECVNYNLSTNKSSASADYIIELWESKETLTQGILKKTRQKTVTNDQGVESIKNRKVEGIYVYDEIKILGRLTENKSGSVLDNFVLLGTAGNEYQLAEVRKLLNEHPKKFNQIQRDILADNQPIVEKGRKDNIIIVQNKVRKAMYNMILNNLVGETKIVGVAEQEKGKLKKAKIEKCDGIDYTKHGTFFFGICKAEDYKGQKLYRKIGTCYQDDDESIVNIKKGAEELLPLLKSGAELYISNPQHIDKPNLTENKIDNPTDLSFVFFYDPLHTYSELDKLHIEFMFQSSMLGYRNIRVIADDPLTNSINSTTTKSIFDSDKKDSNNEIDIDKIKNVKSIFITVTNPKKSLSKDEAEEGIKYVFFEAEVRKDKKPIKSLFQMKLVNFPSGYYFEDHTIKMKDIRESLLNNDITILGIEEEKKGKVKSIIVTCNSSLSKGSKFKLYDKKITKKLKPVVEIRIEELLNNYSGIAKVQKGEKIIGNLIDSGKPIYTKNKSSGSFLLKTLTGKSSLNVLPFYRTSYRVL